MENPAPISWQSGQSSAMSQPGIARCAVHPDVAASFCCNDCGKTFCDTCGFSEEYGNILCTECVARRKPPPVVPAPDGNLPPGGQELARKMAEKSDVALLDMFESPDDWRPETLNAAKAELQRRNVAIPSPEDSVPTEIPERPRVRAGIMCAQHSKVQATQQCRRCGGYMCPTCDFAFPGDVHFCPACVSKAGDELSTRRKKFMIWSYVLAAWSTVGMTCLLSGAMRGMVNSNEDQTALGWVLLIFVLGPAITGLSLGMKAKRKQVSNPATLWIAIIWNAILVASFVVLMLIGLTKQ
jgi:hypothetical protein